MWMLDIPDLLTTPLRGAPHHSSAWRLVKGGRPGPLFAELSAGGGEYCGRPSGRGLSEGRRREVFGQARAGADVALGSDGRALLRGTSP